MACIWIAWATRRGHRTFRACQAANPFICPGYRGTRASPISARDGTGRPMPYSTKQLTQYTRFTDGRQRAMAWLAASQRLKSSWMNSCAEPIGTWRSFLAVDRRTGRPIGVAQCGTNISATSIISLKVCTRRECRSDDRLGFRFLTISAGPLLYSKNVSLWPEADLKRFGFDVWYRGRYPDARLNRIEGKWTPRRRESILVTGRKPWRRSDTLV